MSNVVQFLESLARNPKSLSSEDLAEAVVQANLGAAATDALISRDVDALNLVVGGRTSMMCMIVPAENEPEPEEAPQRDDDEAPQQETSRAA